MDTIYRPWGIYKMALQSNAGTYSRPPARPPGRPPRRRGDLRARRHRRGYWVATINGTWNDTGEIRGQLGFVSGIADSFSMWMTRDYVGILSGQVYGVSDSSTSWVGESVGSYTGTKLAFMAEENGSGKFWDYDSGTSSFVSSGGIPGLIGGTESLFNGAGGVTPYPSVQLYGVGGLTKTGGLDYTTILGQFSGGIPDQAGYRLSSRAFGPRRIRFHPSWAVSTGTRSTRFLQHRFLYSSSDGPGVPSPRTSMKTSVRGLPDVVSWRRFKAPGIPDRHRGIAPGIDDWVSEGRNNYTVSAQGLTDGTITQKAYRNDSSKSPTKPGAWVCVSREALMISGASPNSMASPSP